ncbi:MAG: hypothetical protein GF384_04085 [Elusimicrobia bacterium]|nr:hypothetical protein [Elusimicrobiota bacterium]MBD3412055.1 hypothetical protein [Elusimicrobiota bacterium]
MLFRHIPLIILMLVMLYTSLQAELSGPPITDNNYKVEVHLGPVLGSAKKVALGGAYSAIGDGAGSLIDNPASAGFRPHHSTGDWDYDATIGSFIVGDNDFDNNGNDTFTYENNRITNFGFLLQYRQFGFGFHITPHEFESIGIGETYTYTVGVSNVSLGYTTRDRQWTFGAGTRIVNIAIARGPSGSEKLLDLSSTGPAFGFIWHPDSGPLRFGAQYASAVKSNQDTEIISDQPYRVAGLIIPQEATIPTEIAVGTSYESVTSPFLYGLPLLCAFEIKYFDKTENTYGVESFLEQKVQESGTSASYKIHAGVQVEVLPGRFRLRAGTYHEQSRFDGISPRQHVTGGGELRIWQFNLLGTHYVSLNYAFDVARDYSNNIISIGFWHF